MSRKKRHPDVYTRIRAVLPYARAVIRDGIDPDRAEIYEEYEKAGALPVPAFYDDKKDNQVGEAIDAAYLLGIAVGLLLQPAILTTKGGR